MSIKRRDFLKAAVTGSAAAALPAAAEARPNLEVPAERHRHVVRRDPVYRLQGLHGGLQGSQ